MRAIAKMAMRSPAAASINAAAYAVFALFFAPFMVVSGAILALSTLRFGATAGLRTFAVAMLIGGSGYYILLHRPQLVFLLCMAWLPVLVAGQVLRISQSQGLAMTVCAVFAAIYAMTMRAIVADLPAHWLARLQSIRDTMATQGGTIFELIDISDTAARMHEAIVVAVCLYGMTTILLARWWQAELYNPGGFGVEFRQLLIPRAVSPIAAVVAVFALVQLRTSGVHGLPGDLLVVLVVLFAFQGLALLHHRVHKLGLAKWWLIGFYILLIRLPQFVGLILAFVGIADTLVDSRRARGAK